MMKTWTAFFSLFLCSFSAISQIFPNLKFNQLSVKDGLSTNAVKYAFEDHNGIIWLATSKGLNRYDGTGFKIYRHNEDDSTSICSDAVTAITEDAEHYLWLSTLSGLSRFDPKTGRAVNFVHNASDKNSLASNEKCSPFNDRKGQLWIATNAGLQRFDYKKNVFTAYTAPPVADSASNAVRNSFSLVRADATNRLWALSAIGLYLIDEKNKKLVLFDQHRLNANNAFFQTRDGSMYVGQSSGGIKSFDARNNSYQSVVKMLFKSPDTRINSLIEWRDNDEHNWLCIAASGGFVLMDQKTYQTKEYVFDNLNASSLNAYTVYHVAKDRQNRLWLSTDNGVSVIDPNLQNFENLPLYQQLELKNPKLFGLPNNFLETEDRFYITSYYAKGIYEFDKDWRLKKHIKQMPENAVSTLSKSINSIYKDSIGNFWFSTDSGLVRQAGKKYTFYFPPDLDPANKENLAISKLYKRKDGLFWIRARQEGIYVFDPQKGSFVKHYKSDGVHIDGTVYACFLDKKGVLWVGATKGISRYDPLHDVFRKIIVRKSDGKIYPVTWVTDLTEDQHNTIWAVSDVGLVKIDKAKGTGLLLDAKSGLPEIYLKRIMIDTVGNLWITSQQGIIRYDRKKSFNYFNINNGLPFQYEGHGFFEFDWKGSLLLGFSGYVTRFNPYNVKTNTAIPNIILMDITADGKNKTLAPSPDEEKSITLDAGTRILNIHFAITNYTAPLENNYYYKLGDKATQWQQVKNGDIALGSLPHGNYILSIKGSNNDNVFSQEEKLMIRVLPHWYETVLFKILAVAAIITTIVFFVRRRIDFVRNQSMLKQKLVESELKAIRAQMNPHFIFNVLNSIESYIMENDPKTASLLVQKFAGLSRLILENSTQSLVSADREWKALKLYTELEVMRFNHQFACRFVYENTTDLSKLLVPPMLIQPLIENAIHHGLRNYRQNDGLLEVKLELKDRLMVCTVSDNGIGLTIARQNKANNLLKQQSLALQGIKERIAAINAAEGHDIATFELTEITEKGKSGTIATLTLPVAFSTTN